MYTRLAAAFYSAIRTRKYRWGSTNYARSYIIGAIVLSPMVTTAFWTVHDIHGFSFSVSRAARAIATVRGSRNCVYRPVFFSHAFAL